jgi:hypothetical protein
VTTLLLALLLPPALPLLGLLALKLADWREHAARRRINKARQRQVAAIDADRRAAEDAMRQITKRRWSQ